MNDLVRHLSSPNAAGGPIIFFMADYWSGQTTGWKSVMMPARQTVL